jgi:hypothetical protein
VGRGERREEKRREEKRREEKRRESGRVKRIQSVICQSKKRFCLT